MGQEKIPVELGRVQKTLLLPLVGRAYVSRMKDPFFRDEMALDITERLDFNRRRAEISMGEAGMVAMAVRAYKMDRTIRDFVSRYPGAKILNVGAGLDTAFWRLQDLDMTWYDLDLPDSVALRRKILPDDNRVRIIEKSVFDTSWIEDIGDLSNGLFIQVPGVFPYFEEKTVKNLLSEIAPRLPASELVFDSISAWGKSIVSIGIKRSGMRNADIKWHLQDARKLTSWSRHIELLRQEPFFEGISRDRRYWPWTRVVMDINDSFKISHVVHLRFV